MNIIDKIKEHFEIKKKKQYIINEVQKYAKQKKLFEKLDTSYIDDDDFLQTKSIDDLVKDYNKGVFSLQHYIKQVEIIHNYIVMVRDLIIKKSVLENKYKKLLFG
jgi:hypothetical protein